MRTFILFLAITVLSLVAVPPGSAQASADISGRWHFVMQTPDGDRTSDPTFTLSGDKVSGTWGKDEVKGTFANGKLDLQFEANSVEIGSGTLKIAGQLQNGQITGIWSFQMYGGKFTATRVK